MSESSPKNEAALNQGQAQPGPDRITLIAFAGFVILAGGAAIAIRFTYAELAPYWSGVLRFALVALVFWLLVLVRKVPLPRGRALGGAALFGFLSVGAAFLLVYYGLTKTPASLYSTIAAIIPLLTLFFAVAHKLELFRMRGVAGGLLAVAGIAIAVSGSLFSGVEISLPHIVAILLAAACFAEAGIVIKLFPPSHPYATNAVAMTVGMLMLAAASLILGETWVLPALPLTWLALVYLVVATVGAFLLYIFVLGRWTASGASYAFVLTPIVTVVLASVLTDETISLIFLLGAAVVLAGVYVGALKPAKKPAESVEPAEPVEPPVPAEPALATASAGPATTEHIQARPGVPTCF
jgi:drug/metabolite transporter (DMT)-like permease